MLKLVRPLFHGVIRRRAGLATLPTDRFTIRVARSAHDYEAAFRLVQAAYVAQGIESTDSPVLRVFGHHTMREATVLLAHEGEHLVGTMTVLEDSTAGILLDRDYPNELATLRAQGAKLVELCGLTVVRRCAHSGVSQLLALAAIRYAAVLRGCSHIVVGVHPRAIDIYDALWGMKPFTPVRDHSYLHAPVVGLVGEYNATNSFLRRVYTKPIASGAQAADYVFGDAVFPGVTLPDVDEDALTRWKMPRDVFRALFIERNKVIDELSPEILERVAQQRSRATWMSEEPSVSPDDAQDVLEDASLKP